MTLNELRQELDGTPGDTEIIITGINGQSTMDVTPVLRLTDKGIVLFLETALG
jgi:hypothetical protein